MLLNICLVRPTLIPMKQIALSLVVSCALTGAASAQCFADYKAKQDNPLRLHYGVVQISGACSGKNAKTQIRKRLSAQGWTLLQVLGVFGPEGLDQRKASAGQYFLRF